MNRDIIKGHRKAVKDRLRQHWHGAVDDYFEDAENFDEWETHFQNKTILQKKLWTSQRQREEKKCCLL